MASEALPTGPENPAVAPEALPPGHPRHFVASEALPTGPENPAAAPEALSPGTPGLLDGLRCPVARARKSRRCPRGPVARTPGLLDGFRRPAVRAQKSRRCPRGPVARTPGLLNGLRDPADRARKSRRCPRGPVARRRPELLERVADLLYLLAAAEPLAVDVATRNGFAGEPGWSQTGRLVGHEDLTPVSRHNRAGGWNPGALRGMPRFGWVLLYDEVLRIQSLRA